MSAADQRKVVEALRLALPEGMDRWTPSLVARQAGLSILEANIAIRSLRNTGKIKFGALELSASMLADAEIPSPLVGEGARDAQAERVGEGDSACAGQTPPHPSGASRLPPSPTRGEGDIAQSTTEPCAHPPGEQGEVAAAGDAGPLPSVPGHSRPNLVAADASLGEALLAEVELYLARTRMGASMFGDLAVHAPGYVNLLRLRRTARTKTAEPVRAFMARWPQGATRGQVREAQHADLAAEAVRMRAASMRAAPGNLADEVKAEALEMGDRRRSARKLSATVHNPLAANVVGLQAALLAEPEDAFLFLRRRWPRLLRDVIAQARAIGTTPAAQLAHVIESGLDAAAGSL